jgi:hypothetical protein
MGLLVLKFYKISVRWGGSESFADAPRVVIANTWL